MSSHQPKRSLQEKSRHAAGARRRRLRTVLLATSALASVGLTTAARATDATWLANPASGNFGDAANWDGGAVPIGATGGTATFNASSQRDILLTGNANGFLAIGALSVSAGAGDYTFTASAFGASQIEFVGSGLSAGNGASINLSIVGAVSATFRGSSSAGNASITNGSRLSFSDSSTAGDSRLTNLASGRLVFDANSNAGHAAIFNHGDLRFLGSSTADQAFIQSDGRIVIAAKASGGTAAIRMVGGDSVLDISQLGSDGSATSGTTIGSLEGSGNVFLGSKNLAVGGSNEHLTIFSGVIKDGGLAGGAGGSLTKEGTGTFVLQGVNTYTGLTLVKDGDLVLDGDGSIASSSGAIVEKSGGLTFAGRADVGSLAIQNHGRLFFRGDSHADSAFIASDGEIHFENAASGGKARIALEQGGTLDISGLDSGMTVGSIESKDGNGTVFLGSKNLAVGGNNLSTTFAGAIRDGGVLSFATRGSLTKEGKGALTLTGENTYTGATKVTDGALIVNGSISLSSGVTIESGGTLAGTGTVSSTAVNAGGTLLAGHGDAPFGAITVQGSLAFASGATYLVQVSPDNAGLTNVVASAAGQGTADLGGATVKAGFAKGSYVTKRYNILHADGGLNGTTFGNLANTNLAPFLVASLSYGVNDVFLDLKTVDPTTIPGLNVNQRNVARGIVNSINLVGGAPGAFATLTSPASLTQVSGETAVGSQQATFDAMGQFMGVMLDPTLGGRSAGDSPRNAMASASMPRKAPVAEDFSSRWAVWAAGFGGSQSTNGDAALGSNKTTSSVYGAAAGADYRLSPNTIVGFALAGGGTGFRVANGGSGNSDLFQAGGYLRHTQGAAFIAAALAYGWQDVTTNRTVTAAGFDSLRGRFNANALSGRLEGGYRVAGAVMDVTPYAAGQFISYHLPSYAEQVASGADTFALAYGGKDVTASRTELGVRTERAFAQDDASLVTLRGRLAWAHDFNTDRNVQAVFVTLPGSAFTVNGAQASANTALTSLSAEIAWRNGWAASATFDGQFSDTTKSYAGKGVVRYAW